MLVLDDLRFGPPRTLEAVDVEQYATDQVVARIDECDACGVASPPVRFAEGETCRIPQNIRSYAR